MKKINLTKRQQIILILSSIFVMMLLLNLLTPLLADDYSYSFGLDGRIQNLMDVLQKQVQHYFSWGGRTVAHTIGQIFLMFPKIVFSISNTLIYVLLVWLIYTHAKDDNKEEKPLLLLLIHLCLWFFLPAFGQTCLWLIGSCNYLWTMVIILLFLLPYKQKKPKKDTIWKIIGMLFLGIIAGWTNENTAFGLIVITLGSLILSKWQNKKQKLAKWQWSGAIGTILGFLILILAPGNFVRTEDFQDNSFILVKLLKRIIDCTSGMVTYILPLIIITIVLISIYIYHKKDINKKIYIYLTSSFLTIYAMVLSPTFPERAWFGVVIFLMIAIIHLLYKVENFHKLYKFIIIDISIIMSLLYVSQYITAAKEINELKNIWNYRESYIEKEKKKGNKEIELSAYSSENRHNPIYGLGDLSTEKNNWPNTAIAKYFKIKTIKATTN